MRTVSIYTYDCSFLCFANRVCFQIPVYLSLWQVKKTIPGVVLTCISIIMSKVEPFPGTRLFRAFAYFSVEHLVLSQWFLGPLYKLGKWTFDKIWVSNGISHLVIFLLCLHLGIKISLMQFNFSIFFSNLFSILSHNLKDLPYFKIIKGFSHVYF